MSVFVFALKYGLFMLIELLGSCICVFDIELGWVGSSMHELNLLVSLFSSIIRSQQ